MSSGWMTARRWIARLACVAPLLWACNTPTIPLPPPEPDPQDVVVAVYELDAGKLVLTGGPAGAADASSIPGGVLVTIRDDDSGHGTLVTSDADGRFVSDPFTGAAGDRLRISYEDADGQKSDELCLVATLGRQGPGNVTDCN